MTVSLLGRVLDLIKEVSVADPAPQRSLNRVWIWALLLIVVIWVIYALTGGLATPPTETTDSVAQPQR